MGEGGGEGFTIFRGATPGFSLRLTGRGRRTWAAGHCLVAMAVEGLETGEEAREGARRLVAPFDLAEDAVRLPPPFSLSPLQLPPNGRRPPIDFSSSRGSSLCPRLSSLYPRLLSLSAAPLSIRVSPLYPRLSSL